MRARHRSRRQGELSLRWSSTTSAIRPSKKERRKRPRSAGRVARRGIAPPASAAKPESRFALSFANLSPTAARKADVMFDAAVAAARYSIWAP
jgi:hypothetical protein